MKKKYSRILGVALTLMLLASFFGFAAPVSAATDNWSAILPPRAGLSLGLNLADVEVGPIAVTPDGSTIFAAVNCQSTITGIGVFPTVPWALLQSADGGHNWTATGLRMNPGPINSIALSPNFATDGTMYVAAGSPSTTFDAVFRSINSGRSFIELKAVPPEANGTPTTAINSIDMWPASPYPYVMVGTNTDVWVLQDAPFGVWMDQEINALGPVNIRAVAFAPDFATTNFIWAVTAAGVVTTTNSPGAWGTILGNATLGVALAIISADIGFPSDYSSITAPYLWVGLNDTLGGGGVWRVRGMPGVSFPIQQVIGVDIRSIAVSGGMTTATIIAGRETADATTGALVVGSATGGVMWRLPVMKQPTGASATYVVMAPDFATSNVAYIGTSGVADSAFSVSRNNGMSWNQIGLIDTVITSIDDLAVVSLDTIFMVTNTSDLWKTTNATAAAPTWERILTNATATVPGNTFTAGGRLDLVETSPGFATDGVVLVTNAGLFPNDAVMKSTDGGDIFAPMGAPGAAITALHVVDAIFAFLGATNDLYRTDDGAYSWLAAAVKPAGNVVSIAVSPDYATDGTMLVGNDAGAVYMSTMTRGATFALVGAAIGVAGDGISVAFDSGYATNSIIYAGSDNVSAIDGVWRWYVGTSVSWAEQFDSTGAGSVADVSGLIVSPDGTLYAADLNAVPAAPNEGVGEQGGVQRSLNPTAARTAPSEAAIAPTFEAVTDNLPVIAAGATLNGLWLVVDETLAVTGSKNVLFSIDTGSALAPQILSYTDTLATPVVLLEPEADAIFPRAASVTLQWETLTGARMYFWEIARDAAFTLRVDNGFSGYPTDTSTLVTAGRTYFWRVRVDGPTVVSGVSMAGTPGFPLLSRWSETRTFTTLLGERPWSPALTNVQEVHDNQVPLKPSFQWTGADWATGYEFVLADNADLTSPLVSTTVSTTAYASTVELKYSTAYFWQVRAISATSESEWSDVGTFTTMAEPAPPIVVEEVQPPVIEVIIPEAPPAVEVTQVAPAYLLAIIIIGAVLVIFVVVLIMRTRRPV